MHALNEMTQLLEQAQNQLDTVNWCMLRALELGMLPSHEYFCEMQENHREFTQRVAGLTDLVAIEASFAAAEAH